MKRIVTALIVVLAICVTLSGCRPSGMDDKTYNLGKEAVELAQDFLDGKLPMDEAKDKMDDIRDELNDLDFKEETERKKRHHNSMVEAEVSGIVIAINGLHSDYEVQKDVEKALKDLKDYLGLK